MVQKRNLVSLIVLVMLCGLSYFQFQQWRTFDWNRFLGASHVQLLPLAGAIGLVYITGGLRAFRWSLFVQRICKTTTYRLISPTFVGFTASALLGRPGEFVRPYLIAKREKTSVSSQLGVWTVERIFDVSAFSLLITIDVLFCPQLRPNPYLGKLRVIAMALCGFVALMIFLAVIVSINENRFAGFLHTVISRVSRTFAHQVDRKLRAFVEGLKAVSDGKALLQLVAVSLTIWLLVALACREVAHSYPADTEVTGPGNSSFYLDVDTAKLAAVPEFAGQELSGPLVQKVAAGLRSKGYTVVQDGDLWLARDGERIKKIGARPQLRDLDMSRVLLLMGFSTIGSLVQLPAVGGGNQLAVITALQVVFGFPAEAAVSCGILLWLVTSVSCVPLGLVFAQREHLSLRRLSDATSPREL